MLSFFFLFVCPAFFSYSVSLHHAGKLDMLTGKVLQSVDIDPKLFGEGIVYMEDTVRTTT